MENILEVSNLYKSFKDIKAVNGISFTVKQGSLFAFLGLNGAGKSTTINIICGDLKKDGGTILVDGHDIDKDIDCIKQMIGVVYQDSVLDKQLSVRDNLECRGALYGFNKKQLKSRLEELDELLNIKEFLNRPIGKLSGGQRRRVDIARALLHQPKILILDEPTTGLDPQTRKLVWSAITKLRKQNKITVFLTTHYMEEATDADKVIILDNGKIVASGSPLQLKSKYTHDFVKLYNAKEEDVKKLNVKYKKMTDCIVLEIENSKQATDLIVKNKNLFVDYEVIKGKMDDVFLAATGKALTQGGANE